MLMFLFFTWLLEGGSGSSATGGYVDQITTYANGHLPDDAQRKAVLAAAKELKKAGSEEAKAAAKAAKALAEVAKNRTARSEDFQSALSELRGYSIQLQANVVQQRSKLKSELTREQWGVLHATSH